MTVPDVAMRDYVDARIGDHLREHAAAERAIDAARATLDARLDSVNEFRGQLRDQVQTFVTREVLDTIVAAQNIKLDALGQQALRSAIAAGIVSAVLGLIGGAVLMGFLRGGI